MLTENAFVEHKKEYVIKRKKPVLDKYNNESLTFTDGGKIVCMFTPISDEASVQTYGEKVKDMLQAVIYGSAEISQHDQVEIDGSRYEFISIKNYPSYRLVQVRLVK